MTIDPNTPHGLGVTSVVLALSATVWLFSGASANAQVTDEAQLEEHPPSMNLMCPVLMDEKVDPEVFVEYEGRRLYLCCQKCQRKFVANPQRYQENIQIVLASATDPVTPTPTQEDHDHEPADTSNHGHDDDRDHDHASEEGSLGPVQHAGAWLGKLHPLSVHFPIALLMVATLAELMRWITQNRWFTAPAQFAAVLGGLMGVIAAILGWLFGGFQVTDGDWIMTTHRWVGTATGAVALLIVFFCVADIRAPSPARHKRYLVALLLGTALVSVSGFLGGALIYGIDHLAW